MPRPMRSRAAVVLLIAAMSAGCLSVLSPSFAQTTPAYDRGTYARIDAKASLAPAESCASVAALGQYLGGLSPEQTLKARAIYAWIIAHVKYERLEQTTQVMQEAETVLERRSAVCEGYARLFQALAEAAGLEAVTIIGDAKYGYGETRCKHAWSAVRIDGRWRLLDCTWGCGFLDPTGQTVQGSPELYFLASPEVMIEGHFPDDPKWQLLDPPITRDEFDRRVYLNATYYGLGLSDIDQRYQLITADGSLQLSLNAPDGICITPVLYDSVIELQNRTFCQEEEGRRVITARFPSPGRHTLRLRAWQANDPEALTRTLMDYTVIATGTEEAGFPYLSPSFYARRVHLDTPLTPTLPARKEVFFDITVPEVEEVGVALLDDDELQPLVGESGRFRGSATLSEPGIAAIWALFPDSTKHLALVTYDVVDEVPPSETESSAAALVASSAAQQEPAQPAAVSSPVSPGDPAQSPVSLADLVSFQPHSVVSRTLVTGGAASVALLSLDSGVALDGQTTPGTVLIQVIDGEADVRAGGSGCTMRAGQVLIVPALQRYTIKARAPLKVMSITIPSDPEADAPPPSDAADARLTVEQGPSNKPNPGIPSCPLSAVPELGSG